ncbi:4'-phosphopantetheinyl transferase family protein [Sphingomonas bacterium]|uniref:4'-phosphopantetheinyl transferase family protein n=1 Tax=Sphingomonas bacterium TaxID=1895847 RepID=UPI0015758FD6|nr:4'-phosphopantetheinyl transferase superfamily protein [Sphingomonas bacterium]
MGGLAGAAGESRLNEPRWLVGGDVGLELAQDVPTIWLVSIDDSVVRARAEAVALLPGEAAAVAGRRDAGERLLRGRLARLLLAAAGNVRADRVAIERDAAGRPMVTTPHGWHLSVAARWPACAIGVAPCRLGVDIERIGEDALPVDLLTPAERQRLDSDLAAPAGSHGAAERPGVAAARCWTAKEAHAKWTGHPRDLDPAAIETGRLPLVTSRFGTTRCWLYGLPDHVAAVCTA